MKKKNRVLRGNLKKRDQIAQKRDISESVLAGVLPNQHSHRGHEAVEAAVPLTPLFEQPRPRDAAKKRKRIEREKKGKDEITVAVLRASRR